MASQIYGYADVAKQHVEGIDHDLKGFVLNTAHDQGFSAVTPELVRYSVQLVGIPFRRSSHTIGSGSFRDPVQQRHRDSADLRQSDGNSKVRVASGHGKTRLELNVQRRLAFRCARMGVLSSKLNQRKPCA